MENTITLNMENLSEDEREQLIKLIEKANSKAWKPEYGERYWSMNGKGFITQRTFKRDDFDIGAYSIGNCFKTKEETEFAVEKLEVIAELKRFAERNNECEIDWKDENQSKYFLYYSFLDNVVSIDYRLINKQNNIYFTSHAIAASAIDKIGKDRLKKYYFEVED